MQDTPLSDAADGPNENTSSELTREAKLAKKNSEPIGICIFLTSQELHCLGVNLTATDEVIYRIDSETSTFHIDTMATEASD